MEVVGAVAGGGVCVGGDEANAVGCGGQPQTLQDGRAARACGRRTSTGLLSGSMHGLHMASLTAGSSLPLAWRRTRWVSGSSLTRYSHHTDTCVYPHHTDICNHTHTQTDVRVEVHFTILPRSCRRSINSGVKGHRTL